MSVLIGVKGGDAGGGDSRPDTCDWIRQWIDGLVSVALLLKPAPVRTRTSRDPAVCVQSTTHVDRDTALSLSLSTRHSRLDTRRSRFDA